METHPHSPLKNRLTMETNKQILKMETSKMISFSARFINFMTIAMFFATATFKLNAQCGTVSSSYTVSNNTTCTSLTITNGTYTINSGVTLTVGTITIANGGKLVIKGNLTVTENGSNGVAFLAQNGSQISATSGALIVVGPSNNVATNTVVQFNNGSEFNTLATNATMIVNGSLSNQNNSDNIKVDGNIIINGNLSGGNGSKITGSGSLQTSGSTTLSGSASVFNSTSSCASGPCGYPTSTCSQSVAAPSSSISTISCGTSNAATLTCGTVTGGSGTITYQWQSSTPTSGWANISGATNSTYAANTISTTTNFRVRVTRSSCTVSSNLVKVTVSGTSISNNTITGDETICYGATPSAITATGTLSGGNGSYTYQWQSSSNNSSFSNISGATSATYTPSSLSANTWYSRVVTSGGCQSTSNAVSKQINTGSYTWTGRTNNSWNTTSNWCGNAVPTASDNVTISSGTSNSPIISAITANVKNIEIGTGASLSMANGATLNVAGNWTGTGTFIANDGTNVKFTAASGTQTIAGNSIQYFYNLEKTGASTLSIASGTDLTIRRGGVLKITAGTFDMNSRTVLLKSKIAADGTDSTASLGVVSGTINNASNFRLERYNSAVRGIRYIASPVRDLTAAAFKDSVIIAGPVASGFDAPNTSISTIKEYVESRTSSLSKCFVSFTSINTNIAPGKGYYLFVPGKRTTVYPAAEAVTLVMKGSPVTGNVSFNVGYTATASQGWNLVGNPYPSAIDWDHASWTKAHMDAALYMWNPTTATYYAYVSGISSDGRDNGGIIPSGQGFFVKANAASPVLSVTENAKVNTNTFAKANFRVAQTASYITLKVSNQNGDVDYTTVRFDDGSGNNLSALKMLNNKINMYTKDASKTISYAINAIQNVPAFEVPIYMESPSATVFNVEVIKIVGDMNTGAALKIKDQATGVMTDIAVGTKLSIVPDGNAQRISLVRVAQEAVVTDVADVEVEGGYELYPTHIHNEQHPVLYTYDNFEKKIEVYNASGHKVASHTTHHSHYSFDDFGKHEAGGIYTIKVSANHKTHVFKVMK